MHFTSELHNKMKAEIYIPTEKAVFRVVSRSEKNFILEISLLQLQLLITFLCNSVDIISLSC